MAPSATQPTAAPAGWSPSSWRNRTAKQQPEWDGLDELDAVTGALATAPPLVIPGETRRLADSLAEVAHGRAFLLQAGDCAESFDSANPDSIER
ncbi:MAG: 3-deoxy-7-phosphoheptulonate synthase, partial [Microthrixaceae bacterium]|nr:3-deoxy-7-phosphoheptulonate synthase [Microthrixaceae bacterium]